MQNSRKNVKTIWNSEHFRTVVRILSIRTNGFDKCFIRFELVSLFAKNARQLYWMDAIFESKEFSTTIRIHSCLCICATEYKTRTKVDQNLGIRHFTSRILNLCGTAGSFRSQELPLQFRILKSWRKNRQWPKRIRIVRSSGSFVIYMAGSSRTELGNCSRIEQDFRDNAGSSGTGVSAGCLSLTPSAR